MKEKSEVAEGEVDREGGLDPSDSEDAIGSNDGTLKDRRDRVLHRDLRCARGDAARLISRKSGFCIGSTIVVLYGAAAINRAPLLLGA